MRLLSRKHSEKYKKYIFIIFSPVFAIGAFFQAYKFSTHDLRLGYADVFWCSRLHCSHAYVFGGFYATYTTLLNSTFFISFGIILMFLALIQAIQIYDPNIDIKETIQANKYVFQTFKYALLFFCAITALIILNPFLAFFFV